MDLSRILSAVLCQVAIARKRDDNTKCSSEMIRTSRAASARCTLAANNRITAVRTTQRQTNRPRSRADIRRDRRAAASRQDDNPRRTSRGMPACCIASCNRTPTVLTTLHRKKLPRKLSDFLRVMAAKQAANRLR
eukprot:scaffold118090_cov29-Tisochrysis_lutea.AAC.2